MFIPNRDLDQWITEILDHCAPSTQHKGLLNSLSVRQLADSTYLENVLPKIASDANFIVPRSLYECKTNQVWRYPPHIYADFMVKASEDASIKIVIRFAIPRFLRYGERLYIETEKRKQIARHSKNKSSIPFPNGFEKIALFGRTYDIKLDQEMRATSVRPKMFENTIEFKIKDIIGSQGSETLREVLNLPEQILVIKKFDANSNQVAFSDSENPTNLGYDPLASNTVRENTKIAYIELVYGPSKASILVGAIKISSDEYRISVRLTNEEHYSKDPPRASEWMRRSLLMPHLLLKVNNGESVLPLQQHYESLKYSVENGEENLASEFDKKYYTQTNGVLTKSVIDPSMLCLSTFGVFDTIKEVPIEGPSVVNVLRNESSLLQNLSRLTEAEKQKLEANPDWLSTIKLVLKAAAKAFGVEKSFYKFQWDAIQNRIQILLGNDSGTTTIVKAPTASGKTLVFMVDAVLHSLLKNQRSVLVFPTRILNEDMFRRLTRFIYEMRVQMPGKQITGGIYIGQSDPLYKALSNPSPGKVMIQFDTCPACNTIGSIVAKEEVNRKIGECTNEKCKHKIDYMFAPREVTDYLPLLTIATPDNLFYYSTNSGYEDFNMRFFGGYFIKCQCGYCQPAMDNRSSTIACRKCTRTLDMNNKETSPIGFFVFDEIHSLYGLTGILLSIYLKAVEIAANKITDPKYYTKPLKWQCTFETGTATIANEIELLKAITRAPDSKIRTVPDRKEHFQYFAPHPNLVKYRTILMLPVARSARTSVSNAMLRTYYALHTDPEFSTEIKTKAANSYDFILGYLFRKSDGYTLRRTIRDLANQELGQSLNVNFLSGDATATDVTNLFQLAKNGKIKMLLANLIISLGIDIANMNNIIMMGLPKSMTEFVQTAGRTGRGIMPGHTVVHLLPSNPRDMYAYENFHKVFGDVGGYFETKPIQSTNAYAAKIIFPNILKLMLTAQSYEQYVLTIPSANRQFADQNLQKLILLDVLKALTDIATPDSVKKIIGEEAQNEFKEFLHKWIKISGPNNYMSEWFRKEGHILNTLRENTAKDIPVQIEDTDLFNKVSDQFRPPWAYFPEEEVSDNDAEDE